MIDGPLLTELSIYREWTALYIRVSEAHRRGTLG
jgi:hypothetical protein